MSALAIGLLLSALPPGSSSEDNTARYLNDARRWLVAVFPVSRLPGETEEAEGPSLRERKWSRGRPDGEGHAMLQKYLGSGVIVSAEGEIITSDEVIRPRARSVGIRLSDGRTFKAEVVARYERGNLALLRVKGGSFSPAPLAREKAARPGDLVFTVGNVLDSIGIDGTPAISRGVISRVGRAGRGGRYLGWALETDAAINPGSYGGALLDLEGKVIGIIDTGFSPRRWLGQAIPIAVVLEVLPDLRKGWVPRHTLGVGAEALPGGGVGIVNVVPEGPAAEAGLRAGDQIRKIEGRPVTEPADIAAAAARLPVGARLAIEISRDGVEMRLQVRIGRE